MSTKQASKSRRAGGGQENPLSAGTVHVSARVEYAICALLELSRATTCERHVLVKGKELASAQKIPLRFLEAILGQLRGAGHVTSKRGGAGGYALARSPSQITVADVVRALDGPLTDVRGDRPEDAEYIGAARNLKVVWVATRAAVRSVLDRVTLQDIEGGELPDHLSQWVQDPQAWRTHRKGPPSAVS